MLYLYYILINILCKNRTRCTLVVCVYGNPIIFKEMRKYMLSLPNRNVNLCNCLVRCRRYIYYNIIFIINKRRRNKFVPKELLEKISYMYILVMLNISL